MVNDVHWFVGIDWATQSHCVCLLDADDRTAGATQNASLPILRSVSAPGFATLSRLSER
jgi:hypothetical protein